MAYIPKPPPAPLEKYTREYINEDRNHFYLVLRSQYHNQGSLQGRA
jgi:hypothetical protein